MGAIREEGQYPIHKRTGTDASPWAPLTPRRQTGAPTSEFRLDPLTRTWVAVSGHRQHRPNLPVDDCPFCVGGLEAPDAYDVKAFENRWPIFTPGPPVRMEGVRVAGRGAAEVVLYSADHGATLHTLGTTIVRKIIDLWAERTTALLERPEIEYVLIFENRGADAGATISHPHGQIYAFPYIPPIPAREALVAERHGCPLCQVPPTALVVHEAGGWHASTPFASAWPYGLLLAPYDHSTGLPQLDDASRAGLAAVLVDALGRYDRLFAGPMPYMLWIHQGIHVHVHLAPLWRGPITLRYVAAGEFGSGTLTNPIEPEQASSTLRRA